MKELQDDDWVLQLAAYTQLQAVFAGDVEKVRAAQQFIDKHRLALARSKNAENA